jgi:hypothetical protein
MGGGFSFVILIRSFEEMQTYSVVLWYLTSFLAVKKASAIRSKCETSCVSSLDEVGQRKSACDIHDVQRLRVAASLLELVGQECAV